MRKNKNIFVFDFETENSQYALDNKLTYVWLWDICNVNTLKHYGGFSIQGFIEYLSTFKEKYNVLYSHNLKFDGSFILDYILKNGFVWTTKRSKELIDHEFACLIDERKVFYSITLNIDGKIFNFRDSTKKIPSTVENIAKSWNLPILKGCIDYKKHHIIGDATLEDVKYIQNDTEIIARVLKEFYREGMNKLTSASDSFNAFKDTRPDFEVLFPTLSIEMDDYIRKSYNGGRCFYNPDYLNVELNDVNCYDVNSMYPFIMYTKKLPYGEPIYGKGKYAIDKKYPLYICHIKVQCRIKEGKFPKLMRKTFLSLRAEYIIDTDNEMVDLYLTSIDYDVLIRDYEIGDIEYIDYYKFKASEYMFKDYIEPLYELKSNSSGSKKQLAKIKLNSLYGKFATNPYRKVIEPYIENEILHFRTVDSFVDKPIYTALASFVTAYAGDYLCTNIENNHENFVYCDTDSIHVRGIAKGLKVDKKEIGCWDLEKEYKLFRVIAQKTYYGVLKDDKRVIKACGASDKVKEKITYDEFQIGRTFTGKLAPKRAKGGIILVDTTFTFKKR